MARFSVYPNPKGGYLIDVQADLLRLIDTRVVIPLIPLSQAPKPIKGLNPCFRIADVEHMLFTQQLAAVPAKILRNEVTNLVGFRDGIVAAMDLLFQGF
ncbi:MAG TPA: CcdB family protein [Steroidobacteraceae bacterium]|nr:CcdB family protein [Steroidobacteraceae bacterium]